MAISGVGYGQGYYYDPYARIGQIGQQYCTTYIAPEQQTNGDELVVQEQGEKCTDGKDDGKIGFFSKLFHAAKGIVKTVVNGVKGMVTDKNGNFSLGKTLLSVATTALCIAVPAVGLAACAVGVVAGGIQVGKGIIRASQATTDAEAKEAWQNIGGGAFTVAMSVAGAKAGVKAVKATSTAKGGLASLSKDATLGQKAVALGKDMVSSTKNSCVNIGHSVGAYRTQNQINKIGKKLDSYSGSKANFDKLSAKYDTLTEKYGMYTNQEIANSHTIAKAAQVTKDAVHHPFKTVHSVANKVGADKVTNAALHPFKTAKAVTTYVQNNGGIKEVVISNLQNIPARLQPVAEVLNTQGKYAAIEQFGYNTVAEVLTLAVPSQFSVQPN